MPTLPSYSSITSSTYEYTNGIFNDVLPWVLMGAGLVIAGLLLSFVGTAIINGIKGLTNKNDKYD